MVREEESAIGSGRNEASMKAFATQSDGCTSPPNTHTLKIGCRSQNPGAGYRLSRFPIGGTHHVFKACFGASAASEKRRRTASRPRTLLGRETVSLEFLNLTAVGGAWTITVMFKCFK